jgi:hypothetical protein
MRETEDVAGLLLTAAAPKRLTILSKTDNAQPVLERYGASRPVWQTEFLTEYRAPCAAPLQ